MTETGNTEWKPMSRPYDLEDRTYEFGKAVRDFIRAIPMTLSNIEDAKQVVRSSGSVGANYIEANEAVSRNDFIHRTKICRKEARESRHWLRLLYTKEETTLDQRREALMQEAYELTLIFSAILRKRE